MAIDKSQKNINIQEKANLIQKIATHLYGEHKPHEYGKVFLTMTVIKRFDNAFQRLLGNDQFQKAVIDIMSKELYKKLVSDNKQKEENKMSLEAVEKAIANLDAGPFQNLSRAFLKKKTYRLFMSS